mgnify:CR=1 FL=1
MKLDYSKFSNKDDLVAIAGAMIIMALIGAAVYLAVTENKFLCGFLSAIITLKWKAWVIDPIDSFLERNWPETK